MLKIVYSVDKYPPCHTYNYNLNAIRYLCCCKQTVYKVVASTFSLFFRQANGRDLWLIECSRLKQIAILLNEL